MGFKNFARDAAIRETLGKIANAGLSAKSETPRILRNEDGSFSLDITGLKDNENLSDVKNFDKLAKQWKSVKFNGPSTKIGSAQMNLLGQEVKEDDLAGDLLYSFVSKQSTLIVPSELTLDEKSSYKKEMLNGDEAYYRDLVVAMYPALDEIKDNTAFASYISNFEFELDENNKLQVKSTSKNPNVFKALLSSMRTQLRTSVIAYQNSVSKYFNNIELSKVGSCLHRAVDTVVREFALGTLASSRQQREEKFGKAREASRSGVEQTKYQAKTALGEAIISNQSANYESDAVARTEKLIQVFKDKDEKFFEERVKKLAEESSTKIDEWNLSKETMISFMASEYAKAFTENPENSILQNSLIEYLKKNKIDPETPAGRKLLGKCMNLMFLQPEPLAEQFEREA